VSTASGPPGIRGGAAPLLAGRTPITQRLSSSFTIRPRTLRSRKQAQPELYPSRTTWRRRAGPLPEEVRPTPGLSRARRDTRGHSAVSIRRARPELSERLAPPLEKNPMPSKVEFPLRQARSPGSKRPPGVRFHLGRPRSSPPAIEPGMGAEPEKSPLKTLKIAVLPATPRRAAESPSG